MLPRMRYLLTLAALLTGLPLAHAAGGRRATHRAFLELPGGTAIEGVFNKRPGTWTSLGRSAAGSVPYQRGISSYMRAKGSAPLAETLMLIRGDHDTMERYVSTKGRYATSLDELLYTNAGYAMPLVVRGMLAPSQIVSRNLSSDEILTIRDHHLGNVGSLGVFYDPDAHRWSRGYDAYSWAMSYLATRRALIKVGMRVDPASKGAAFTRALRSALRDPEPSASTTSRAEERDKAKKQRLERVLHAFGADINTLELAD